MRSRIIFALMLLGIIILSAGCIGSEKDKNELMSNQQKEAPSSNQQNISQQEVTDAPIISQINESNNREIENITDELDIDDSLF